MDDVGAQIVSDHVNVADAVIAHQGGELEREIRADFLTQRGAEIDQVEPLRREKSVLGEIASPSGDQVQGERDVVEVVQQRPPFWHGPGAIRPCGPHWVEPVVVVECVEVEIIRQRFVLVRGEFLEGGTGGVKEFGGERAGLSLGRCGVLPQAMDEEDGLFFQK